MVFASYYNEAADLSALPSVQPEVFEWDGGPESSFPPQSAAAATAILAAVAASAATAADASPARSRELLDEAYEFATKRHRALARRSSRKRNQRQRQQQQQQQLSRVMPLYLAEATLNLRVGPIEVSYAANTRRGMAVARTRPTLTAGALTLSERLRLLDGWHLCREIAIDGQTGTSKSSTIAALVGRSPLKVNNFAREVTRGSDYNWKPWLVTDYVLSQTMTQVHRPVCWDRSPYANLVFTMVHYLMGVWTARGGDIPVDNRLPWSDLRAFCERTNLHFVVSFVASQCSTKLIVVVNRMVDLACEAMLRRGICTDNYNDVYNASSRLYPMAQYHAYGFMAQMLGPERACLLDIADFVAEGYNFNQIQTILADKLNWRGSPNEPRLGEMVATMPDREATVALYEALSGEDPLGEVLTYSKK